MSPFPHVRREQVPITDPRWLASTQPDPEPEVDERRGLDGNGTMRASDLPASTWGAPQRPGWTDTLNMDAEPEVRRTKCLALSDDVVWPQQCSDKPGHLGKHDWERKPDSPLTERRRDELRDTPSDVLPRRVPGEALRVSREVIERWPA